MLVAYNMLSEKKWERCALSSFFVFFLDSESHSYPVVSFRPGFTIAIKNLAQQRFYSKHSSPQLCCIFIGDKWYGHADGFHHDHVLDSTADTSMVLTVSITVSPSSWLESQFNLANKTVMRNVRARLRYVIKDKEPSRHRLAGREDPVSRVI